MRNALTIARRGVISVGQGVVYIPPPETLPEAEWLMRHVTADFAITQVPGDTYVRSYLSLYGALGLVRAYEVTGNEAYLNAAWGWAGWYRDRMDPTTGYVDDYIRAYQDTFTRADGAVGNGWSVYDLAGQPDPVIHSNTLASQGSTGWEINRDIGSAPQWAQVHLVNPPSSGHNFHLFCGYGHSGTLLGWTGVSVSQGGTGDWRIWTWNNGTATQQVLNTTTAGAGTVRLAKVGNVYTATLDGTTVVTWTDTGNIAQWGGHVSVFMADPSNAVTNFLASLAQLGNVWLDTGIKDSTDAYAGMYLTLLFSLYRADSDGDTKIAAFAASIPLALTAIESTQQIDGLTYALPTYDVKYLEDNVEALYGARSAQNLAFLYAVNGLSPGDDSSTAALYIRAKHTADELARGVGILWNWETHVWDYAIHSSGFFARNDWSDPNAQRQQIWATGWGEVVTPLDGANVLAAYVNALPTWATESAGGQYEIMATWAFRRANDVGSATSNAGIIEANALANNRDYPWTCQDSGLMLIGQYGFPDGMSGHGQDGLTYPAVIFPDGTNFIPNPTFVDSNSDGLPDDVSNYNSPGNSVHSLLAGGNAYQMVIPNADAYAAQWPTFDLSAEGGTWYCFSIYKLTTYLSDPTNSKIVMTWEAHDASDNLITYSYSFWPGVDTDGVFKRIWMSFLVPDTGTPWTKLHLSIGFANGPGTFLLAAPKFEKAGASPTPGPIPVLHDPAVIIVPLPFTDTFNRANGPIGLPWIQANDVLSDWTVQGNAAYPGTTLPSHAVVNTGLANQSLTATVKVVPPSGSFLGLQARRYLDNYYELQLFTDYIGVTYLRLLANTPTSDVIWYESPTTYNVGDTVGLQVVDTSLKIYHNGTVVGTVTDSSITTGNYAGISASHFGSGPYVDAFTGWDSFTADVPPAAVLLSAVRESDTYGVNDGWTYTIPTGTWHVGVHYQTPDTALHDFAAVSLTGPQTSASGSGLGEVAAGSSGVILSLWLSPTSNYADRVSEITF